MAVSADVNVRGIMKRLYDFLQAVA